jgi:hypothetical protein
MNLFCKKEQVGKTIILIVLFTIFYFASYAQSKEDTQTWLNYYLNEYSESKKIRIPPIGFSINQSYFFQEGRLVHWKQVVTTDVVTHKDSISEENFYYIDLSQLKKVEITIDTSASYDFLYSMMITLHFDESNFNENNRAIMMKDKDGKPKDKRGQFHFTHDLIFEDENVLKEEVLFRIKKAIEHLAILDGAHLIKDVF